MAVDIPYAVTTRMWTVPDGWLGAVTESLFGEARVSALPGVEPNSTLLTRMKFFPVIVKRVPPVFGPAAVVIVEIDGDGM